MLRELGQFQPKICCIGFPLPPECYSHRKSNSRDPMDPSLFQVSIIGVLNSPASFGISEVHSTTRSARQGERQIPMEKVTTNSRNLDLLRSFAVLLVVGFHL